MSEQAQTMTAPETVVPGACTTPAAEVAVPAEAENRKRRPNRGMQGRQFKNAAIRLSEVLAEVKQLKQCRAQDQIEAQAALAVADKEIQRLRAELLAALSENGDYKSREEQRLFQIDEDRKASAQVAADHRLLCFRAIVDCAHQSGIYSRHPDFNTQMKRAELSFSTSLLESILCFPPAMAPELAFLVATTPGTAHKLSALSPVNQLWWLLKTQGEIEEQAKWANLANVR